MALTGYASRPHYAEHLAPIATVHREIPDDDLVLVASWRDHRRAIKAGKSTVYMEHGAGQSYQGTRNGSYVGADRTGAVHVLAPNQQAADRHSASSDIPVTVVGCPKLDRLARLPKPTNDLPVVAVSNHWNCRVTPETRSGWDYFRKAYPGVAQAFPGALGHAHPRLWPAVLSNLTRAGLRPTEHFDDVCKRADVYVVDNSSTLFEFAALDRPVVVLNPPWYRRDVHHGGRFWDWADIGVNCDHPDDLIDAITLALADPPDIATRRRELVDVIYPHLGTATARAVETITAVLAEEVAA